jgi:hypothetical protein
MNILNLSNPTDNELEAKILQMIRRYSNIQNESGNKLAHFFNRVYEHFFDTSDESTNEGIRYNLFDNFENAEEEEGAIEGFKASTPSDILKKYTKETEGTSTEININNPEISQINGPPSAPSTSQLSNIIQTQPLEYSTDKTGLNPLIKQTIKRIVNIDSQFRNKAFYPLSTDFTFNLSEPLKDVLSLKLYSVQIPYTWYTINNNYGSNFLYLKGVTKGVDNGSQDYQIVIPTGNYTNVDFSANINTSINSVKQSNPGVNFGTTSFSYNTLNSKSTFTVDIQNIYNEPYYQVLMDISLSNYLLFADTEYPLNTLYSTNTAQPSSQNYDVSFNLDNSCNYFTVIHYTDASNQYNYKTSSIKNIFPVYLSTPNNINGTIVYQPFTGLLTRNDVKTYLENGILNQPLLDPSHSYVDYSINPLTNQYQYTLSLQLNKRTTTLYPNSKLCIQFSSKNQYKDASGSYYGSNHPFWCNEYVALQRNLNSWTYLDISNLDASYNNHKTVKWRSVAMSDNGLYQTAIVSMNTPYDNSVSNIFYSYT